MIKPTSYFTQRRSLVLGQQTHMVGILNLTPDSFSDGGDFVDLAQALQHFHQMVQAGATIIDIGGESTRPGHVPISVAEEIARVVPFIEQVRGETRALISIDTSKSEVAAAALLAGADIVNDVWGAQRDPQMAAVIGQFGCFLKSRLRGFEPKASGTMRSCSIRGWASARAMQRIGRSCVVYLNWLSSVIRCCWEPRANR